MRRVLAAAAALGVGALVASAVPDAAGAESRRALGHNTVGTSFPYHPGYFRFWFGERDLGLVEPFYPVPASGHHVNPDPVPPFPHERQFSRSRHATGSDLWGAHGGSPNAFDVDAWYGRASAGDGEGSR